MNSSSISFKFIHLTILVVLLVASRPILLKLHSTLAEDIRTLLVLSRGVADDAKTIKEQTEGPENRIHKGHLYWPKELSIIKELAQPFTSINHNTFRAVGQGILRFYLHLKRSGSI